MQSVVRPTRHYVVGIFLGVGHQATGWAIVGQTVRPVGWSVELELADVGFLDRLPLNTSLPDVIKHLNGYLLELRKMDVADEPEVIVDVTGYGAAAMESFREAKIPAIKATIKGRDALDEESTASEVILGKIELLGVTRRLLEHGRLKVRNGLDLADEFKKNLAAFDPNPPRIDKHDPEAWRDHPADDLVYAVALAVWWSDKHLHAPKATQARWDRKVEEHNKKFANTIV